MGGGGQAVMKRIPRIKFPQRHSPKPSTSISGSASGKQGDGPHTFISKLDVPPGPINTAVGGKASLQPKRTPVTDKEIEAIMSGGCL